MKRPLLAITLDLDDTLWPSRPVLLHAEQVLATWLAERAPATVTWLDAERRRTLR
ncbi:MAG TPA: HAD family hydrolase, partial [Burkholderiaceae bacterium]|nr:HAD family hydrolase [Burkholderiaceae bacterium]